MVALAFAKPVIGQSGMRLQQYTDPSLVVTFAEMRRACVKINIVFEAHQIATENVEAAEKALRDPRVESDPRLRARLESDLHAKKDSLSLAVTQLDSFNRIDEDNRRNLAGYCRLKRLDDLWELEHLRIPEQETVRSVAEEFEITYNPESRAFSVPTPGIPLLGASQSALVSGFAQFLVNRADQELRIAFVSKFQKWACASVREILFTSTCIVLEDDQLIMHEAMIRNIRVAIEEDLRRVPRSLPMAALHPDRGGIFNAQQKDLVLAAYYVGSFLVAMLDGEEPLQALANLLEADPEYLDDDAASLIADVLAAADSSATRDRHTLSAILYRVSLTARMLPDGTGDGKLELPEEREEEYFVKALAVNAQVWLRELGAASPVSSDTEVSRYASELLNSAQLIGKRLIGAVNDSREIFESLVSGRGNIDHSAESHFARFSAAVDGAIAFLELWLDVAQFAGVFDAAAVAQATDEADAAAVARAQLERAREFVNQLRAVARNVSARNYAGATLAFYRIANELRGEGVDLEIPQPALRFTSFASAIAEAETGDQAAEVISQYAAPVGSYRMKRQAENGYLFLQGYLGIGGGWEMVDDEDITALGAFAPVGIEFGTAKDGWSIGVFGQVLDVGVLASHRLQDTGDVETEPEVGFAQVFSPGAYLVVGFPKVPITIGGGFNLAPRLRTIDEGMPTERSESALRAPMFFVSVDIPIFRLG
jgi:hypothetical protein